MYHFLKTTDSSINRQYLGLEIIGGKGCAKETVKQSKFESGQLSTVLSGDCGWPGAKNQLEHWTGRPINCPLSDQSMVSQLGDCWTDTGSSGTWGHLWTNVDPRDTFHKWFMSSKLKSWENYFHPIWISNGSNQSQYCTCYDSSAVVTCAILQPAERSIIFHIPATSIFLQYSDD